MTDQGYLEQAKEKFSEIYDATKNAANDVKEKIVGEPCAEDKMAEAMKTRIDSMAETVKETRQAAQEKMQHFDECHRTCMNQTGDLLQDAGSNLQETH